MMRNVPLGWKDDEQLQILTAPNGIHVRGLFREYILSHSWHPMNQPLGPHYQTNPVQFHRLDLGGGERQLFSHSVLWWSPQSNLGVVDEQYMGEELEAAYKTLSSMKKEETAE